MTTKLWTRIDNDDALVAWWNEREVRETRREQPQVRYPLMAAVMGGRPVYVSPQVDRPRNERRAARRYLRRIHRQVRKAQRHTGAPVASLKAWARTLAGTEGLHERLKAAAIAKVGTRRRAA